MIFDIIVGWSLVAVVWAGMWYLLYLVTKENQ